MSKNTIFVVLLAVLLALPVLVKAGVNEPNQLGYTSWSKSESPFKASDESGSMAGKLLSTLLIVILLGGVAYYLTKKLAPKISTVGGKNIKVVETVSLGSQRHIHLIEADGKRILLGSTNNTFTKLSEMSIDDGSEV